MPPALQRNGCRCWDLSVLNVSAAVLHFGAFLFLILAYQFLPQFSLFTLPVVSEWSEFATDANNATIRVLRSSTLLNAQLTPLVAVFPLVTGLFHVVEWIASGTVLTWLQSSAQHLRWVEYAITAPYMLVAISLICGVQSIETIIGVYMMCAASMLFAHASEKEAKSTTGSMTLAWMYYLASWAMTITAWAPATMSFTLAVGATLPWFVWATFIVLVVLQLPFPSIFTARLVYLVRIHTKSKDSDDDDGTGVVTTPDTSGITAEKWYVLASFIAKAALTWITVGAVFSLPVRPGAVPVDLRVNQWVLFTGLGVWSAALVFSVAARQSFPAYIFQSSYFVVAGLASLVSLFAVTVTNAFLLENTAWYSALPLAIGTGAGALVYPALTCGRARTATLATVVMVVGAGVQMGLVYASVDIMNQNYVMGLTLVNAALLVSSITYAIFICVEGIHPPTTVGNGRHRDQQCDHRGSRVVWQRG